MECIKKDGQCFRLLQPVHSEASKSNITCEIQHFVPLLVERETKGMEDVLAATTLYELNPNFKFFFIIWEFQGSNIRKEK